MSSHRDPRWSVRIALIGLCLLLGIGLLSVGGASDAADAAAATTVPSPYANRIGMNTHEIWGAEDGTYTEFARMAAIGVTRTREGFEWRVIEPQRGRFDWSRTDQLMAAAARARVDVLPILGSPPAWASNHPDRSDRFPPANNADYVAFARAVVARYHAGGTFWTSVRPDLTPMPLTSIQIWNEPWSDTYWGPLPDPAGYARLVRATGSSVHGLDRDIDVVIAAELLQTGGGGPIRNWIDEVLRADPGLGAYFDVYSVHPYPAGSPMTDNADGRWDFRRIEIIHQITVAHDMPKPVWITEVGWSTAPNTQYTVSETTQASYTRQAITRAFDEWPYVKRFYLYSYDRDNGDTTNREAYFGVRRQNGTFKPVWTTLAHLLEPRTVTTSTTTPPTTAPPTTTPPTTTPPTTSPPNQQAVLGPARLAVRVLGHIFYYDPAPT